LLNTKIFFNLVDPNKDIVVAFSGGIDSSALLNFCYELKQSKTFLGQLSAIHVNHNVSKNSDLWEEHCKNFCNEREIPLCCKKITVDSKKAGLESAARKGRYKIFEQHLGPNDQLLLAHHADDVAETILFRLFRGTGLDGLQGPLPSRQLGAGVLIRPWLSYPKSMLSEYLRQKSIEFVADESNERVDQDRNFIRNEILNLASNRWPKAGLQIQQTSQLISQHMKVYESLLDFQFGDILLQPNLERNLLIALDTKTCAEVIRYWIKNNRVAMPNKKILQEIMKAFIYSNPTAKTKVNWSRADKEQSGAFLSFCGGDLVINKK
jgi:tRNA(Ile)-lysidine synthase